MMARSFFFLVLACGSLAAHLAHVGSAHAQEASRRVLVLAPAGDARLATRIGAAARDHATATLTGRGFVAARGPAGCSEPDCATELLSGGAAEYALAIALWGRTRCERVAVTLVDAHGVAHSGEVTVTGTDVNAAVEGAIGAALEHLASGGSSTLSVTGTPAGATITLDQIPWGTLPHSDRVPHGDHQLAVSADGYTTDRRSITIASEPVSVDLTLAPSAPIEPITTTTDLEATPEVEAPPSSGPDVTLLAIGGATAGVGLALLAVGAVTLALPDSGMPMAPDFTYERAATVDAIGWLVAGGVSLAAGVVLFVVGLTSGSAPAPRQASRPSVFTF